MSTSLLCFEILLDAAALISPEVVSPDEVTLESRVSLLPITTWNKIGTRKLMIMFRIYRSTNSSQKHNSKISLPCCLSSWRILLQPMMWRRWLKESPWNFIKKSLRPSSNCYTDFGCYIHISFINDTFSVVIFLPTLDWRKKQLVQFQQRQMPCQTCWTKSLWQSTTFEISRLNWSPIIKCH